MPSKGIDFYGYVGEGFSLELKTWDAHHANERTDHLGAAADWQQRSHEVNTNLPFYTEGKVQFFARKADGSQLYERSLRVDGFSGNINGEDLNNILEPSRVEPGYCLSYGVYNSDGAHISDLPNRHQLYASLTQPQHDWQHRLFAKYRERHDQTLAGLTLSRLVLPGSHDAGMYLNVGLQALTNMANTQRDNVGTQLRLGARYFDFRPGRIEPDFEDTMRKMDGASSSFGKVWELLKGIGIGTLASLLRPFVGQLRHVHLIVPGETCAHFLDEIGRFLHENSEEVVVVRFKDSGFMEGAVSRPAEAELRQLATQIAQKYALEVGEVADLKAPVQTLLNKHRRLIILYREDKFDTLESYNDSDKDDPDTNYQSYEWGHIMNALRKVNQGIKANSKTDKVDVARQAWADVQLQLTATALAGGATRAIAASSLATSPLLATKPRTDAHTYPWVRNDLALTQGPLVTVCNDFYDNALTEVTYQANLRRLGLR